MAGIILITGATAGIGEAAANKFAAQGFSLILTGRREDRLDAMKARFAEMGTETQTLLFDIRDSAAVEEAWDSLPPEWQQVDVLLNNAGLALDKVAIQEGDAADWDQMIDTNVKGLLYMTRLVSPGMVERKSGHIINLGSLAGHEVYPGGGVYCATKHAVDAITKGLRQDLIHDGVRVSAISPGLVETEFSLVRFKGDEEMAKKVYEGFDPLTAADIAETIWFTASAPKHVNIAEMVILAGVQADSRLLSKK